ncbi:hypothetical protein RYA05_02625 [Pseudomonas syringae pv. actinidiae]|nr:hypothetical protein [Pseudomonas syringae pv. actinidiae]
MKFFALPLLAVAIMSPVHAADHFRFNYLVETTVPRAWVSIDPLYGTWTDEGAAYGCTNWSPSTSSIGKGVVFEQKATDCKQNQVRTVQSRRQDPKTSVIENSGPVGTEKRNVTASSSASAVGILENWVAIAPTYTDWVDVSALYGCTSWSPDPASFSSNIAFSQNSSSCKTDQSRQRQDREQESYSRDIRNSGAPTSEQQTRSNLKATRSYAITFGEWSALGEITSCSNWSPDPATVDQNKTFTQNATNCKRTQTRSRQESYVDNITNQVVSVPKADEQKSVTASNTRDAVGTKAEYIYDSSNNWQCNILRYVQVDGERNTVPIYEAQGYYKGVNVSSPGSQLRTCPISVGRSYGGYTVGPAQGANRFSIKKN